MKNLWENKQLKEAVLKMYFEENKKEIAIAKKIWQDEKIALSRTKIKKDIGRIIHRRLNDLKLNRTSEPVGKCPICNRDVFLRDRTRPKETFSCICEGAYINKCYFRINKKAYGLTLYNNIVKELLEKGKTKTLTNLTYKNQKVKGQLILDMQKKGFINFVANEEKESFDRV